ncbi:MAG: hypothetical protein ABSA45_02165 [Verrucomicrobiota bacterium]
MIIWQGRGFLVAVIIFGCSLVANLICNAKIGPGYYDHHKWPFAVSLLCSSAICWFLGDYLRKRSDRIVIDKQTGKEFVLNQSRHTLFFIPMRWWGLILLVGAMILFAIEFSH